MRAVAEAAAKIDGAVIPVVPVTDSLKRIGSERVIGPLDRDEVAAAQTPQAARLGALRAAIEEAHAWGRPITDDAGALAAAGTPVHVVAGDPVNRKLTEPSDLVAMRAVLAARASGEMDARRDHAPGVRVGIGFDAHRLVEGRPMRLAGVTFAVGVPRAGGPLRRRRGPSCAGRCTLRRGCGSATSAANFHPDDPQWAGADSRDIREASCRTTPGGRMAAGVG